MRVLALLVVAGCAADIPSGSYLCGPDSACPEGQVCDGPTNTCVVPSAVTTFVCDPALQASDDTHETASSLGTLACVSAPVTANGCLDITDHEDWYQVTVPAACGSTAIHVDLVYPLAFAQLDLALTDMNGSGVAGGGGSCSSAPAEGDGQDCIYVGVPAGASYAIRVRPVAYSPCNGDCVDNHYALSVRLSTN